MNKRTLNKTKQKHEQSLQHPKYEYLQWHFPYFIFKAILINEGETTRLVRRNNPDSKQPLPFVFGIFL